MHYFAIWGDVMANSTSERADGNSSWEQRFKGLSLETKTKYKTPELIDKLVQSFSISCLDYDAKATVQNCLINLSFDNDLVNTLIKKFNIKKGHLFVAAERSFLQVVSDCQALFDPNDERCLNPATFYLYEHDKVKKDLTEQQLLFSLVIFLAHYEAIKYRLVANYEYKNELEKSRLQIIKCAEVLCKLRDEADYTAQLATILKNEKAAQKARDERAEKNKRTSAENSARYACLWETFTSNLMWVISSVNARRLYTVWGKILLALGFIAIAANDALKNMGDSSQITSPLSVGIYIFRGSVAAYGYLRNSYFSESYEDEGVDEKRRRAVHYKTRKLTIRNDGPWTIGNFLSAYGWLIFGQALFGVIGDALTSLLLIYDWRVTVNALQEKEQEHKNTLRDYDDSLKILLRKIRALSNQEIEKLNEGFKSSYVQGFVLNENDTKLAILTQQYIDVEQSKNLYLQKIKVEKENMQWDKYYAFFLMGAFALVCGLFISQILTMTGNNVLPIEADKSLNIVGSLLCLLSTIMHRSMQASVENQGLIVAEKGKKAKFDEKMDLFFELKKQLNNGDNACIKERMKIAYLEILKLGAATSYQHDLVEYKQIKFMHDTFLRLITPAIFFVIFLAMPLPGGLFAPTAANFWYVFAGLLAVTALSYMALDAMFKPKDTVWEKNNGDNALPEFDKTEYENFVAQCDKKNAVFRQISAGRKSKCENGLFANLGNRNNGSASVVIKKIN